MMCGGKQGGEVVVAQSRAGMGTPASRAVRLVLG